MALATNSVGLFDPVLTVHVQHTHILTALACIALSIVHHVHRLQIYETSLIYIGLRVHTIKYTLLSSYT